MFSNVNAVWVLDASSPVTASENVEPNYTFHLSTVELFISYFKTEKLIKMTCIAVHVRCVICLSIAKLTSFKSY
jgi:hypothetical protein